MTSLDDEILELKRQELRATKKLLAFAEGQESLLRYLQLQMPDPEHPDDPEKTRYHLSPQAKILCHIMEKVERGELQRVAVSIGPQMGKTQIISRGFPAWAAGRDPSRHFILGSYNQTFAEELGNDVTAMVSSPLHQAIFPDHVEVKSAASLHITTKGGKSAFVGVGGSGSGKPADFFVVDDPIKGEEEANSETYRDLVWRWFNGIVFARCRNKTAIVIVHTRWHEDDLIGRLCDPNHPERDKKYAGIADRWTYINLPAVVDDPKMAERLGLTLEVPTDPAVVRQFGDKPIAALYPQEKALPLLAEAKMYEPRTFEALYMGRPAREDGEYFNSSMIVEYEANELPPEHLLTIYGASDHAVSAKQNRDYTVAGCVGVDGNEDIWVLPDLVWRQMETDKTVEELLNQFKTHRPQLWWMESELISKSFGPFLKKRMTEERIFTTIDQVVPSKDKQTRARAIQGRMSMQKVRLPRFAPWFQDARRQLLAFPYGANDDFVDWISHIGQGLMKVRGVKRAPANENSGGTLIQQIMKSSLARARQENFRKAVEGY